MNYTDNDQAIMLLCAHLPGTRQAKSLTTGEWDAVAAVLQEKKARPEDLLDQAFVDQLPERIDRARAHVEKERIKALLLRGHALGMMLADWKARGIAVVTRASKHYPAGLRRKLGHRCPPLFYVAGNFALLQSEALGIVGSRDATAEALDWARRFGEAAAQQGVAIVSGAAKGIDEAGMLGALAAGGTAVGYLADSLLKTAVSARFRNYIGAGQLVLLTPFAPDARFSVGAAMGRNAFIYAGSVGTCVAACAESGGTMEGVKVAVKTGVGTVWVRNIESPGMLAVKAMGALPLREDPGKAVDEMLSPQSATVQRPVEPADPLLTAAPSSALNDAESAAEVRPLETEAATAASEDAPQPEKGTQRPEQTAAVPESVAAVGRPASEQDDADAGVSGAVVRSEAPADDKASAGQGSLSLFGEQDEAGAAQKPSPRRKTATQKAKAAGEMSPADREAAVLKLLDGQDAVTCKDVEKVCGVSKSTASSLLRKMVEEGRLDCVRKGRSLMYKKAQPGLGF